MSHLQLGPISEFLLFFYCLYGIFILGEALLTEELLESVISALKHLKASDDLKNIEIANLYIEILNFYPKDSLSRFIKSLLADNLADLNHHATNAVAKAIALTTILCFFEKHSELVGPSFAALLPRLPLEAAFVAPKNNRIIQKLVGDVAWQFCSHQVGERFVTNCLIIISLDFQHYWSLSACFNQLP